MKETSPGHARRRRGQPGVARRAFPPPPAGQPHRWPGPLPGETSSCPLPQPSSQHPVLSLTLFSEAAKAWLSRGPFGRLFWFLRGLEEFALILPDCSLLLLEHAQSAVTGSMENVDLLESVLLSPDSEELLTRALFGSGFHYKQLCFLNLFESWLTILYLFLQILPLAAPCLAHSFSPPTLF